MGPAPLGSRTGLTAQLLNRASHSTCRAQICWRLTMSYQVWQSRLTFCQGRTRCDVPFWLINNSRCIDSILKATRFFVAPTRHQNPGTGGIWLRHGWIRLSSHFISNNHNTAYPDLNRRCLAPEPEHVPGTWQSI